MLDTAPLGIPRRDVVRGKGGRAMLVELGVMQRRCHAVMKVVSGAPVTEVARSYVARSYRASRQSVARVRVPDFWQPQV